MTPEEALTELYRHETPKTLIQQSRFMNSFEARNFFKGTRNSTGTLVRRINACLDDNFSPRMVLGDHYELCRDEYHLQLMISIAEKYQKEGELQPLPDNLAGYSELMELWGKALQLQKVCEQEDMHVVVCGLLKAGKSSLLNCLLDDREDSLFKVGCTRTTVQNQIHVDGGICFIDTPGLEANKEDTEEARQAYQKADLLLFVHDGERELVKPELELLHSLLREIPNLEQRLVIVITHIDQIGDQLVRLEEKIRDQLVESVGLLPIHKVSKTRYKKSFEAGKEAFRKSSGVDELRQFIKEMRNFKMNNLKEERNEKWELLMREIEDWFNSFGRQTKKKREEISRDQNEIFVTFEENILSSIRKQLMELR